MKSTKKSRNSLALALILAVVSLLVIRNSYKYSSYAISSKPASGSGKNGVVASENEICSKIGVEILKAGGNGIDSTIATTLCIGVTNFQSSGLGGGGFLVYRKSNGDTYMYLSITVQMLIPESISINFREKAPALASTNMYINDTSKAAIGGLSVGVPGELMGLYEAHKRFGLSSNERYGTLDWKLLVQPSVKLSRDGWKINARLSSSINGFKELILKDKALSSIMAPKGVILKEGDIIKRIALSKTLQAIADEGADVFYKGWIADSLVEVIQNNSGIITKQDFLDYNVVVEVPLLSSFRGRSVLTAPPPASGGVLLSILNIMEHFQNGTDLETVLGSHRLLEAFKHAYSQRAYFGDPMSDPIYKNISQICRHFVTKGVSDTAFAKINDNKTFPIDYYKPVFSQVEDHGTMHVSIMTASGDAVSLTSTVNLGFGSKIMDPTTGIILNDQMDDFSIPGFSNTFGLAPSPYNFIHPGKRPLSSSVPSIIIDKKGIAVAAIGASGGSQIISSTAQTIIRMFDMDLDTHAAIHSPRFHHQLLPDVVVTEARESEEIKDGWKSRGHAVNPRYGIFSGVSAVKLLENGEGFEGSGDERKQGSAVGY